MQNLLLQTNYHNISYKYSSGLEKGKSNYITNKIYNINNTSNTSNTSNKNYTNNNSVNNFFTKNLKNNKKNIKTLIDSKMNEKKESINKKNLKSNEIQRFNLKLIPFLIEEDKLEICIVSYGGTGSNNLVNLLKDNGILCRTKNWEEYICHCPEYFQCNIPVLYIYSDPRLALMSMYKRGKDIFEVNQLKLSNKKKVNFSEENLLKLMIKQFKNWYNHKNKSNIYFIKSKRIYTEEFYNFIKSLLKINKNLIGFPLKYKEPSNTLENIPSQYNSLFTKYKEDIEWINNL